MPERNVKTEIQIFWLLLCCNGISLGIKNGVSFFVTIYLKSFSSALQNLLLHLSELASVYDHLEVIQPG